MPHRELLRMVLGASRNLEWSRWQENCLYAFQAEGWKRQALGCETADGEIKRKCRKRNEEPEQGDCCDASDRAMGLCGGQGEWPKREELGALDNNN